MLTVERKHPKKWRKRDFRRYHRTIFQGVIEAYNQIRSTMAEPGAMDYSTNTGAQGKQFDKFPGFTLIDFTIDVQNVAFKVLDTHERRFFERVIKDEVIDYTHQTDEFLRFQEKIGAAFLGNGLWPLNKYFRTIKR